MIQIITKPFRWFFKLEAASGLVLLFAAIIALIVSNSNLSELYFVPTATPVSMIFELGVLPMALPYIRKDFGRCPLC